MKQINPWVLAAGALALLMTSACVQEADPPTVPDSGPGQDAERPPDEGPRAEDAKPDSEELVAPGCLSDGDCTPATGPCEVARCEGETGRCELIDAPAGAPCDDADACTESDACASGACQGATVDAATFCDDTNACTSDQCDPASGCVHAPVTCDADDACAAASCHEVQGCVQTPVDCDDGDACTFDTCDAHTGCVHDTVACDDGNACTEDSCAEDTGCAYEDTGAVCDDGDACTEDSCAKNTGCVHDAVLCDDGNPCTDDSCTKNIGCSYAANSASCDDGDDCTKSDLCDAGKCVGGAGGLAPLPAPTYSAGQCPVLFHGTNTGFAVLGANPQFGPGVQERSFILQLPQDPVGAPVIFAWHWLNGKPDQAIGWTGLNGLVDQEGVILVSPYPSGSAQYEWFTNASPNGNPDLELFDDILACLSAQFNVDLNRIWATGHSAGALWTSYLTMHRSEHLAATAILSGGVQPYYDYTDPVSPIPVLMAWGGTSDVYGAFSFDVASQYFSDKLQENGHNVLECVGDFGHALPPSKGFVWEFLKTHPRNVFPEPYASGPVGVFPQGAFNGFPEGCAMVMGTCQE